MIAHIRTAPIQWPFPLPKAHLPLLDPQSSRTRKRKENPKKTTDDLFRTNLKSDFRTKEESGQQELNKFVFQH